MGCFRVSCTSRLFTHVVADTLQSLARLIRNAAEEINHPNDESRSLWTAQSDGGDWAAHQLATNGVVEEDLESLFGSETGVRPLGYAALNLVFANNPALALTTLPS